MPYLPERDIPWMVPLVATDLVTQESVGVAEVIARMAEQNEIEEYEVLDLDHDAYEYVRLAIEAIGAWYVVDARLRHYESPEGKQYALRVIRKAKDDLWT